MRIGYFTQIEVLYIIVCPTTRGTWPRKAEHAADPRKSAGPSAAALIRSWRRSLSLIAIYLFRTPKSSKLTHSPPHSWWHPKRSGEFLSQVKYYWLNCNNFFHFLRFCFEVRERSAVRLFIVTTRQQLVTIAYSDRFLVPPKNLLILRIWELEWKSVIVTLLPIPDGVTVTADYCNCCNRVLSNSSSELPIWINLPREERQIVKGACRKQRLELL